VGRWGLAPTPPPPKPQSPIPNPHLIIYINYYINFLDINIIKSLFKFKNILKNGK